MKSPAGFLGDLTTFYRLCGYPGEVFPSITDVEEVDAQFYISKDFPAKGVETRVKFSIPQQERKSWSKMGAIGFAEGTGIETLADIREQERRDLTSHLSAALRILMGAGKTALIILGSGCEPDPLQGELEPFFELAAKADKLGVKHGLISGGMNYRLEQALEEAVKPPDPVEQELVGMLCQYDLEIYTENWTRKLVLAREISGGEKTRVYPLYHNCLELLRVNDGYSIVIQLARLEHREFAERLCSKVLTTDVIIVAGYSLGESASGKAAYHGILTAIVHKPGGTAVIVFRRKREPYAMPAGWPEETQRVHLSTADPLTVTEEAIGALL